MTQKDITLREIQERQPWSIAYSQRFLDSPVEHKDFCHALIHIQKAAGKLAAMVDDGDHGRPVDFADAPKFIADLVNCALRMANTLPSGKVDLQQALLGRIAEKNGVWLDEEPVAPLGGLSLCRVPDAGDGQIPAAWANALLVEGESAPDTFANAGRTVWVWPERDPAQRMRVDAAWWHQNRRAVARPQSVTPRQGRAWWRP